MEEYLASFEEYLKGEKCASENTTLSYMRDIRGFTEMCRLAPDKVTVEAAELYLNGLFSKGRSMATVQRARASMNAFFAFLVQKGVVASNPIRDLKIDSGEKALPQALTTADVEKLLNAPSGNGYKSIRDKAMLELLYATGIKASELIALDVDSIDTRIGFVRCGNRIIPIYTQAAKLIQHYITNIRPYFRQTTSENALFLNNMGGRMTRQGFWKIVRQYAEAAGIDKPITPQILRHSFALHLFQNGADLKTIQQMLGHSDISTTQVYAKMFKNELKEKYNRYHPLARG